MQFTHCNTISALLLFIFGYQNNNKSSIQRLEGVVVFFLKHLYHARQIRNRILECFERASNPTILDIQRNRLLSFIVVGGGPTSCEFMSELHEFINDDVASWYPDLVPHIKLTLVEAGPGILGSFDKALSEYYLKELEKKNIDVRLNTAVAGIDERYIDNEQVSIIIVCSYCVQYVRLICTPDYRCEV